MSGSPEVFVSYARTDAGAVYPLVERLREAGVTVWIDRGGIDASRLWAEEIVHAITGCRVMVVMATPAAFRSPNVAKEVLLASEEAKPLVPVYLEPAAVPPAIRYPLAGVQHIELYHGEPDAAWDELLRALQLHGVDMRAAPPGAEGRRAVGAHPSPAVRPSVALAPATRPAERLPAGPIEIEVTPVAAPDLAPLSLRFWAAAIDVTACSMAVGMVDGALDLIVRLIGVESGLPGGLSLPLPFVLAAYSVVLESSRYEGTLGKLALGLRTVSASGARLSPRRAFRRALGLAVNCLVLGWGFLAARRHPRRQAWHDRWAGTIVVLRQDHDD